MMSARSELELSDAMSALLDRLRRDSVLLFGTGGVEIVPVTFQIRESSEVARAKVTSSTGVRWVFAKIFKPRPGEVGLTRTLARFREDYDVTKHVFDAMRAAGELRSVEPLVCYEDLLGVVTDEAAGLPLSKVVARNAAWPVSASSLRDVERALHRVGRWVAMFQRVAPDPVPSRMSLDVTRRYIDSRMERLTKLPRARFSQTDRREVLTHLDLRAAEVSSVDLVDVPVHGDIVPSNIVVAPDRITVLDFGMTSRGSRYLDVARLYTQLDFYTAKPQYRPSTMARLQQVVLDGFEPGLRPDNPLFEICAIQHVVCHLLSHVRSPGSFPSSVYSRHQCRRHRLWLRAKARGAKNGVESFSGNVVQ